MLAEISYYHFSTHLSIFCMLVAQDSPCEVCVELCPNACAWRSIYSLNTISSLLLPEQKCTNPQNTP